MDMMVRDIDWNEVWKDQMKRSKESSSGRDCARIWEGKDNAMRFLKISRENADRVENTVAGTDITPQSRVLDIGAGPGTLAIPFSKKVAHVTAVEPASGMVSVLEDQMRAEGAQNISVVQKRWEDVDISADLRPPYDVVIASFSLGMNDIRSAIEKMIEASSKYIYLYHFAGDTSWDRQWREIWPRLHGREYSPGPKCDVLYNVLYQMGIYSNVSTFDLKHDQRYSSLDEALEAFKPQAKAETDEQVDILRQCLRDRLIVEDGSFVLPSYSTRVKIWWKK
jgi:predicted RNA methylase